MGRVVAQPPVSAIAATSTADATIAIGVPQSLKSTANIVFVKGINLL